ncbi:hypothetical protein C5167_039921 [Papaver somniferum]|uniref:Bms1-type G domain-containing protein n=1 Tax=Papaver somniferum TaxID=3469 RepID=A0A4Y7IHQ7_PAPSO|nr:uncharacterized protein LOC113311940 [Papaver somniferum]RZC46969.1 hypothetical protein C5167_039921 [Papaver somniferum]
MAFASSSSSSKQQIVLCGPNHVKVYKNTTTADNSTEAATSDEQMEVDRPDFMLKEEERPPYVIVVHGPPKVGKEKHLFIRSLVDHYTEDRDLLNLRGPITIITGKRRRIQFVECPNNVNGMRDAAKYADAVIFLINAYVGFEMETFEFVNVLRVHGMPKVMGVLTSIDKCDLFETKEHLMNHFSIEICEGATVFCLSGLDHGMYPEHEIRQLASFISAMDFHPLSWQAAQPYVLAEHFEDVTRVHTDNRCNRDIVLHGYLRGCDIKKGAKVHIAGVGNFHLFSVTSLADPCPFPAGSKKKRSREEKKLDEGESFRPGTYLRLEVRDIPFEIVENYVPYHPILVEGISPVEEKIGYMQKDTAAVDLTMKLEEPPYVIVVHGPPKVGKSRLIRSLVKRYTKKNVNKLYMQGPVTIISGKQRRIQFVECPNNINGMLDAAKYADAVMLLIDADTGFQMETFEFVNILRVHGMPKVMGVLISDGMCADLEKLLRTKECLMNHFCTEIYEGARLFCLSGLGTGMYPKHEILDLASFISIMEFHPLSWRAAQPYVLVDRFEDVTPSGRLLIDYRCTRDIVLYGYLRGCDIKEGAKVHIAGVGDFPLFGITSFVDPCPLKSALKRKKSLKGKEQDGCSSFRPGTYLRLEVRDIPFEMVGDINPGHPILVGGISPREENIGYMQATLKRHTWHRKLLKTRDPIIVSIGWRRYQTSPVYAMDYSGDRLRMLNYTPVDMQCLAMFWGPLASPNTGVVVVQDLPDKRAAFRILATGVVVDFNHAAKILKKCKRSRIPWKISGKTALIKNLFKSDDEIDRFKDAKLWTESGIQGKVEKAAEKVRRRKDGVLRVGIVECKFKRRICMHDTIFMRMWKEVKVPGFFNPFIQMTGLSHRPDEFPKGVLFKHETDGESPTERRMVAFVEGEPSFQDLTIAKEFELYHCNKEEQKEFKRHPMLVMIPKEEEMLEIHERGEITKKHQTKPWTPDCPVDDRVLNCAMSLYGKVPTYFTFFRPRNQIKYKN